MSAPATPAANPFAAFLAGLKAYAESKLAEIKQVAAQLLPEIASDLEVGLEDIAEIAFDAVLTQAPAVISGNEKFGNAVASVVQTVEAGGKTVAIQTAQTAVQAAYLTAQSVAKANTPPA